MWNKLKDILTSKRFWFWYLIFWVITVPLTIALAGTVLGVVIGVGGAAIGIAVGVFATVFSVTVALVATAFALVVAGLSTICLGLWWMFFKNLLMGVINFGLGLAAFGFGVLLSLGICFVVRRLFKKPPTSPKTQKFAKVMVVISLICAVIGAVIFTIGFAVSGWDVEQMNLWNAVF